MCTFELKLKLDFWNFWLNYPYCLIYKIESINISTQIKILISSIFINVFTNALYIFLIQSKIMKYNNKKNSAMTINSMKYSKK